MFHLYSLFMLIYLLLHVHKDFCLTVFCWLITSHKSIPVLEIDPSKVIVKFLECRPWYSIVTPFFPLLGGFKDPEGSKLVAERGCFPQALPKIFFSLFN